MRIIRNVDLDKHLDVVVSVFLNFTSHHQPLRSNLTLRTTETRMEKELWRIIYSWIVLGVGVIEINSSPPPQKRKKATVFANIIFN